MAEEVGLGLSLSLGYPEKPPLQTPQSVTVPFPLNLFRSPVHQGRAGRGELIRAIGADGDSENRGVFRGIDMNRAATSVIDCDEDAMASSPNSTVSSLSGKRSEREENDGERSSSLEIDDDGGDAAAKKKLRLSKEQAAVLEETFKEHNTLNPKQKKELAIQLKLQPRQVEVWFQNRRARTKLKQTEVDCEYLRRCCDNLTEENRRLQKELTELRALKLSPQFYMNMSPPTTLIMCPQCERVNVSSATPSPAGGAASTRPAAHHQRPLPVNSWAAAIFTPDANRPRT